MNVTTVDISALVAQREGKNLEFKRGLPRDEKTARTLAAFANTRGGILLVGVGDRGEIVGAPRPRETLAHLREIARDTLDPPLAVQAGSIVIERSSIVWCSVPLSPDRPHAVIHASGEREIVVRVGSSNRKASGATLAVIQTQRAERKSPDALQRSILAWVARRTRNAREPGGDATVALFAKAQNVGVQRARRAFTQLELAGRLVGHGSGAHRVYGLP